MKILWAAAAVMLLALTAPAGGAYAQSAAGLVIPGESVAKDPTMDYKVVFDVNKAAPGADEVNPALKAISQLVNTLAKAGVPADHRHIAIVIHQGATKMILGNDTFKARYEGHDNPDLALIRAMTKAGVKFYVCGQAVLANKIEPKTIVPEVELTLWALTTIINLELRGYVRAGV
jgi:intracellular sulfur oxidation DsrE/DsrF family protein